MHGVKGSGHYVGARITKPGPFMETAEQLSGYLLIRAGDLDQALAIAVRIPAARTGSVEVRPIVYDGPNEETEP